MPAEYPRAVHPVTKAEFLATARNIAATINKPIEANFKAFLLFAYDNPTIINKMAKVSLANASSAREVKSFLQDYVLKYFNKRDERIALKLVSTKPDMAVDFVLEVFGKHPVHLLDIAMEYHRLSMAAENKVGDLLEHYLTKQLEPHGWFWCSCNIIKGVDFFKPGKPVTLLQIKNRSNSENSSSSAIRKHLEENGCPVKIDKWYRINASTGKTYWETLPGNSQLQMASEKGFHEYIKTYFN